MEKKTYLVEGKLLYDIFYEDSGWYSDYEWFDMEVKDVERDEVEEYVKSHRPRPTYLNGENQYKITGVEIVRVSEKGEGDDDECEDDE